MTGQVYAIVWAMVLGKLWEKLISTSSTMKTRHFKLSHKPQTFYHVSITLWVITHNMTFHHKTTTFWATMQNLDWTTMQNHGILLKRHSVLLWNYKTFNHEPQSLMAFLFRCKLEPPCTILLWPIQGLKDNWQLLFGFRISQWGAQGFVPDIFYILNFSLSSHLLGSQTYFSQCTFLLDV